MEWYETPEGALDSIRLSLQTISMFLYNQSLPDEENAFIPFDSTQELAKFLKMMIDPLLPEDMRYKG